MCAACSRNVLHQHADPKAAEAVLFCSNRGRNFVPAHDQQRVRRRIRPLRVPVRACTRIAPRGLRACPDALVVGERLLAATLIGCGSGWREYNISNNISLREYNISNNRSLRSTNSPTANRWSEHNTSNNRCTTSPTTHRWREYNNSKNISLEWVQHRLARLLRLYFVTAKNFYFSTATLPILLMWLLHTEPFHLHHGELAGVRESGRGERELAHGRSVDPQLQCPPRWRASNKVGSPHFRSQYYYPCEQRQTCYREVRQDFAAEGQRGNRAEPRTPRPLPGP